jgi:hypothetical protein
MRKLHTTVGWPRVAVDALDMRLHVDGFRFPGSQDTDADLDDIWLENDLDAEHSLAHLDALVFGRAFVCVGSPPDPGDAPLITVESPLDIAVEWDARTRSMTAALRMFGPANARMATLYLPNETVSLAQGTNGWSVEERDQHRLGRCLITRITNRPRSFQRHGASEITPEIMSLTDAACRTLLGLAVAGEFYSAPQRYVLGAAESSFQDAQGNVKSAWETYLGRVLALERDEDGQLPSVGQFNAYNPAVYTEVLASYAQRMSSLTGLPPHILGFATANPTSADAIRSAEMELTRRADAKTVLFGKGWRDAMRLALMVRDGSEPADASRLSAVWASTATPTIGATTDAVFKQIQAGYLPATSDVVGEVLGYDTSQRARIEADRQRDQGSTFLAEIAHSLTAKDMRTDNALARSNQQPASTSSPAAPPVQP